MSTHQSTRKAQPRARRGSANSRQSTGATLSERLAQTLIAFAGLPCVSGQEQAVRAYIRERLAAQGVAAQEDAVGNLIARIPGVPASREAQAPLLLSAHMDRVPPGRAHTPVLRDGILRSDGTTNLGADNSAGVAVVLHVVEEMRARGLSHPPLLLLFTAGEEIGQVGAKGFDPAPWGAREGLIFDNVGEAGAVVTRAGTYIAFDVTLHGYGGHPGKQLEGTASTIEMFRRADYPVGSLDDDTTRISIGRVEGGSARNAIATELRIQGEARTLLEGEARAALLARIERAFVTAAESLGGTAEVTFNPHCDGYSVDPNESLLRAWETACHARGLPFHTMTTFIGSDSSVLRKYMRAITISTGAMDEHTTTEWIALDPLADLIETVIAVVGASA
jgi:tripeptide aminopeptidase